MANRKQRALTAAETLEILEQGQYSLAGNTISLARELSAMRSGSMLFRPDELRRMVESLPPVAQRQTRVNIINGTTLQAARALIEEGYADPLCLNFASAKNPGGGFQSGAQAQEECLARASALYASLTLHMDYYLANRNHSSSLYTNHMIYSPSVAVFRDDADHLLPQPYTVSVLSSPAVNAGAVRQNEPHNVSAIQPVMEERIRSLLAVARAHAHDALVLGAWGCGVFRNDPAEIAAWFHNALFSDPRFRGAFTRIVFAILDKDENTPTLSAFAKQFGPNAAV